MGAPKKPLEEVEGRKQEIVEASDGLFRQKGFMETSIEDIVKSVGIAHGTFYRYFPTKRDVLLALIQNRLQSASKQIRAHINDHSMSPTEKFRFVIRQINQSHSFRVAVDFIGFGFIRQDMAVHNELMNMATPVITPLVAEIIQQGNACGEFRVEHPEATALCYVLLSGELIHRADVHQHIVKWPDLLDAYCDLVGRMLGMTNPGDLRPRREEVAKVVK